MSAITFIAINVAKGCPFEAATQDTADSVAILWPLVPAASLQGLVCAVDLLGNHERCANGDA